MKNLFNDPKFVVALSILALAFVLRSVMQQGFNASGQDQVNSTNIVDDLLDATLAASGEINNIWRNSNSSNDKTTNSKVNRELIGWIIEPPRDPFAKHRMRIPTPTLGAALAVKPKPIVRKIKKRSSYVLPVLKALFHDDHGAAAVIDGKLVRVGDNIAGFEILTIMRESVVIEKSGNRFTLLPARS